MALVQVRAAQVDEHAKRSNLHGPRDGRVASHGWLRESAEFGQRELGGRVPDGVGRWQPARAQHHRHVVAGLTGDLGQFRRAGLRGRVCISHVVTIEAA